MQLCLCAAAAAWNIIFPSFSAWQTPIQPSKANTNSASPIVSSLIPFPLWSHSTLHIAEHFHYSPFHMVLQWYRSQPAHRHPPQGPATVLSPLWIPRANHSAWHIVGSKALFIEWMNERAHESESWKEKKKEGTGWVTILPLALRSPAVCWIQRLYHQRLGCPQGVSSLHLVWTWKPC